MSLRFKEGMINIFMVELFGGVLLQLSSSNSFFHILTAFKYT